MHVADVDCAQVKRALGCLQGAARVADLGAGKAQALRRSQNAISVVQRNPGLNAGALSRRDAALGVAQYCGAKQRIAVAGDGAGGVVNALAGSDGSLRGASLADLAATVAQGNCRDGELLRQCSSAVMD